jgi:HlyD family secretion protein
LKLRRLSLLAPLLLLAACGDQAPASASLYETATVDRRDIAVTVEAAGTLEPVATVELKSKASGEVLEITAETGDVVAQGDMLVRIDPRTARNRVAQAEADLESARARLSIARAQQERAAVLREQGVLSKPDYEKAALELAQAQAQVVAGQVAVENARIALGDTMIRAPVGGTIIEKKVEKGQVISSPTQDVGGGTLLLKMADLARVQVRVSVDETDIGKIRPGQVADVSVSAYPNQPFMGEVLKVEPQAVVEQNVTLFGVLVSIDNRLGLLKPGMNAEVTISIAKAEQVLTVPVAALRTQRDLRTTAGILGLDEATLRADLEAAGGGQAAPGSAGDARPEGAGRPVGGPRQGGEGGYQFGSRFWVVLQRGEERRPVPVQTGLTDLDRAEVTAGLAEGDTVLLLPSTHLVETQQELQNFVSSRIGGVPGIAQRDQQQPQSQAPSQASPPQR